MPQFSSRHSSFNLRLRSCGSSNSSAIFLPRPATLTTTSQLHHFSSCSSKTIRIIAVEVLQQLQRQLLELSYPYDGFRDSFWSFRTPTTRSAIAFGGFVHLRRLPRQLLELSYPYDGFRDSFWDFRTPTTGSKCKP